MSTEEPHEPAPPRTERARLRPGRVLAFAASAVLVLGLGCAAVWMLTHQQRVVDQITVWQFEPDATIQSYAERSAMSEEGRFLFYASTPSVHSSEGFDGLCSSQNEEVGVLGCYVHSSKRIYLYDVTDERLDGIEEVVASHEMLHAAWDRMSEDERQALAPLLEAEATARQDDEEFTKTLEYYAAAEPGERLNELHSIIGTEFGSTNPELERHYARYFSDRSIVVALHAASDAVFTAQQDAIASIVAQLDALKTSVDTDYASYNVGFDQLNTDIASFNARADGGGFSSPGQFRQERDALVERQTQLESLYTSIAERKAQYEDLRSQLDALNAQVTELNESINIAPRSDPKL